MLLKNLGDAEAATTVAAKIVDMLARPVDFHGQAITVGASVDIALIPTHGDQGDVLLQRADQAMYRVKKSGKNGLAVYEPA